MADEAKTFDISSLKFRKDQDDGIAVDITHPKTGGRIGLKIWVAGPDSERQRKAKNSVVNERLQLRNQKITAELLDDEGYKFLAKSTFKWEFDPGTTFEGETEWSEKGAIRMFTNPDLKFIFDQVNAVAGERAGFIKG